MSVSCSSVVVVAVLRLNTRSSSGRRPERAETNSKVSDDVSSKGLDGDVVGVSLIKKDNAERCMCGAWCVWFVCVMGLYLCGLCLYFETLVHKTEISSFVSLILNTKFYFIFKKREFACIILSVCWCW